MSEQNIWNGSYVLGDTSATTIIAGDGIKVDSSVPGTIRISNDETVLYSASDYNASTSSINFNIPLTAFDYIRFYDSKGHVCEEHFPSTDSNNQYIMFQHLRNDLLWNACWYVNSAGTNMSGNSGCLVNCNLGVPTGTPQAIGPGAPYNRWIIPMKVVGINRLPNT